MPMTIHDMAENIKRNLTKNGFPEKSVSLPLEKLYESAHNEGLNFNKVLDVLTVDGIGHEKTAERIIFSKLMEAKPEVTSPFSGFNMDSLKDLDFKNMDMGSMMSRAKDLMKSMSPDQLKEIKKMYDNMSPEERQKIMDQAKNLGKF
jgi:hypothetical protein